jgi:hypothetical protein
MKSTSLSLLAAASLGLALASNLAGAQEGTPAPGDNTVQRPATAPGAASGSRGMRDGMSRHQHHHASHGQRDPKAHADRQARRDAIEKLTTPEERTAFREKMRSATPEQRQQLAAANRTEMQRRAAERGVTLPEASGPMRGGHGSQGGRGHHGQGGRQAPQAAPVAPPVSM